MSSYLSVRPLLTDWPVLGFFSLATVATAVHVGGHTTTHTNTHSYVHTTNLKLHTLLKIAPLILEITKVLNARLGRRPYLVGSISY
jgi:hypothetical protein